MLNKAESILRQYFAGRSLGELEFGFLLRHLDDMDVGELTGAVEWAAKNSRTLANLADDAVDYLLKNWDSYLDEGIAYDVLKFIEEEAGSLADDVPLEKTKVQKLVESVRVKVLNGNKLLVNSGDMTPEGWIITEHVAEQLNFGGRFNGNLSLSQIDEMLNSSNAIRVIDSRSGNINTYVESDFSKSSLLRITVPQDGKRIVFLGFEPLKRINRFVSSGIFIEL